MEHVATGGLEIAYQRAGEGPPLLLLHGAAEDGRIWTPQLAGLADDLTVIAWDEPGAGRSSDLPEDFGLEGFADAVAALLDHLDLGPAHLAGLSWGGTVALEVCRRHPRLVRTLLLIDTYAGWKGSLPAVEVQARVDGARRMLAVPEHEFDPTFSGTCSPRSPSPRSWSGDGTTSAPPLPSRETSSGRSPTPRSSSSKTRVT